METLEANLPGKTVVIANGDLLTVGPLGFEGSVALQSEQPATLASWWAPDRPKTALDAFTARARVVANAGGVTLTNLEATVRGSKISGDAGFTPARSGRKARLSFALDADRIDVDQVQAVSALLAGEGGAVGGDGADVDLRVAARELRAGDTSASGVDVAASLKGGTLAIDRFVVADLAGARLSASGTIRDLASTPDGSIQARLSADKVDGIARLLAAALPGSEIARLAATAAPVLGPAMLEGTVAATAGGDATAARIALQGSAGGTTVSGSLVFDGRVDRWRDASVDLAAELKGPNGLRLMRQLGIAVPDAGDAGLGSLTFSAKGRPGSGVETALAAELGPTRLSVSGKASTPAEGDAKAALKVSVASPDVGPILALSGNPIADLLDATPVDLAADVTVDGAKVGLGTLFGWVAEAPVSGDVTVDFSPAVPTVAGRLTLKQASFAGLGELALGPGTLALPIIDSRNPWPEAPFGPSALDGIDADLALAIGKVDLGDGLQIDDAALSLRASASGIGFDGITGTLAGGKLGASVVVKRDLEGMAAVSGTVKLDGADAGALVWKRGDQAVISGTAALDLEANATGRTVAGLLSSLAGAGRSP